MTDLQTWLIALGILLILLVVLINWWQDRRVRRRMQAHFPDSGQDPLMASATGRREPGFGADSTTPLAATEEPEEVDPAIEAVIDVHFAQPAAGHALAEALQPILTLSGKPVRLFAQTGSAEHHSRLLPDENYVSLQLAVLLSNRRGPLTDIEWSKLWAQAQNLTETFEGSLEGPEQNDVLKRAYELDQACAALDAQVALTLQLENQLSRDEVLNAARDAGFLLYGEQMAWMAESGLPRFLLLMPQSDTPDGVDSGIGRVDLLLDLPQTTADAQAFSRMAGVGRDLATRLGAALVDDRGHALSVHNDEVLDAQLLELYIQLEEAGYPAGAARTIRLFS